MSINNFFNKKTSIVPKNSKIIKNIFQTDISSSVIEISNFSKQEEKQNLPFCRICFEETNIEENILISPCLCKGTQKYIHINCLNEWREINRNNPEKRNKCEVCNFNFLIHNNLDYLNYTINIICVDVFIVYLVILMMSSIYGILDYSCDFFTVKILNLFIVEKSKILKFFRIMKKNNDNSNFYNDGPIRTVIYTLFITTFINFLVFNVLIYKTFKKLNQIENIEYNYRIKKYKCLLKTQQSSFLVFYYFSLIANDFNILISALPLIIFCNIFSYSMYILKSNSILEDLNHSNTDVILSFENNPLLEIESVDDED